MVCESGLSKLRETAKTEGYMNDSTAAVFDRLEKLLHHDLQKDLDHNRKEISRILADEIQKRYYFQRGSIIESLKDDEAIDSLARIFANADEYHRLLKPAGK